MENVKAPTSSSYREYLISSLKDYEHAAYIAVMLELDEEGYDPTGYRVIKYKCMIFLCTT